METCASCGFEYVVTEAEAAGAAIVDTAGRIAAALVDADRRGLGVRARRDPATWSGLEYACHVRDVLLVQRERVLAARRVDRPAPEPMGRDERVDHDGYAEQEPVDVARQLVDAAALFANVLARLGPDDWDRMLVYTYPTPSDRSLRWVAVHTLHEVRHHALDMERQLATAP